MPIEPLVCVFLFVCMYTCMYVSSCLSDTGGVETGGEMYGAGDWGLERKTKERERENVFLILLLVLVTRLLFSVGLAFFGPSRK